MSKVDQREAPGRPAQMAPATLRANYVRPSRRSSASQSRGAGSPTSRLLSTTQLSRAPVTVSGTVSPSITPRPHEKKALSHT